MIVVGGGHAGIEAALICAKMGAKTRLFTMLIDNIGLASCNPAIGGLGKGHLVKELDALGGVMGEIADNCGLQYRILNASKGPAVRGTRAQIDMDEYRALARDHVLRAKNLTAVQESVENLLIENFRICGVITNLGKKYFAKRVILTTGTFLRGLVHIGEVRMKNGRFGENASNLSENLTNFGFELRRLKTGTCPRVSGKSIDFTGLEEHHGDPKPPHFSYRTKHFSPRQIPCFMTYTNENSHNFIRKNLHRAPMFIGQIEGVGPRYCPSIEDKIFRFAEKDRHQLFLEPQTRAATEFYINGLSTSLPYDVQEAVVRSIKGLENAEITRFGYAIEYDFINPTALHHTLETKAISGLFFAGQINGTTGYEEAAAQGIMAGINAALSLGFGKKDAPDPKKSLILRRDEGYIGVMIDDLVTKGTNEPYRVFTSRAEYRLLLREDNAIFRLYKHAHALGLMEDADFSRILADEKNIQNGMNFLKKTMINPSKDVIARLKNLNEDAPQAPINAQILIARENFTIEKIRSFFGEFCEFSDLAILQLKILSKYDSYIKKQEEQILLMKNLMTLEIPHDFQFQGIGLSLELVEKLQNIRPKNLFSASQIPGMTPAGLDILHVQISLYHKKHA